MPDEKGLGSKIMGVFFEKDSESAPADAAAEVEALVKGAKGNAPPPPPPGPALKNEKLVSSGGPTDFDAVFRDAGMDAGELDHVKKAEQLIGGLPPGVGADVQRQIVDTSLRAFGIAVEKIVAAATNQLRALDTYVKVNESLTQKAVADAEKEIVGLTEKIAGIRRDIEKRNSQLAAVVQSASARKSQVQRVMDFFGQPKAP